MTIDTTVKGNKAIMEAAITGIKAAFPKGQLKADLKKLAKAVTNKIGAQAAMSSTAEDCVHRAETFSVDSFGNGNGQTTDRHVASQCWLAKWRLLMSELDVKDNPIMELSEPADPKKTGKPRMTGYGRNVSSTCSGVVEFGIKTEGLSFSKVQKAVQDARAEANPSEIRDAKAALTEQITLLRKRTGTDVPNTQAATAIVAYINESIETEGMIALVGIGLLFDDVNLSDYLEAEEAPEQPETAEDVKIEAVN